jgi:hypothetical protein
MISRIRQEWKSSYQRKATADSDTHPLHQRDELEEFLDPRETVDGDEFTRYTESTPPN